MRVLLSPRQELKMAECRCFGRVPSAGHQTLKVTSSENCCLAERNTKELLDVVNYLGYNRQTYEDQTPNFLTIVG